MYPYTRLSWNVSTFLVCFLFLLAGHAIALASFATNPHQGYTGEQLKRALDDLPKERHELIKRQLDQLLSTITGATNAAGPLNTGLGILDGLGDFGDVTWPLDVWSRFPYRPPAPGDQRGPCPGLNALANHGLIARSGNVGLLETLRAAQVMGMSFELALLTLLLPFLLAGDPVTLTMSIGGPSPQVDSLLGGLGGLLGPSTGLANSHGYAELDSSATRDDLYVTGDPSTMNVHRFIQLWSLVPPGGRFDMSVFGYWAAYRFHESIHTNPNFWYGPIMGLLIRTGTYALPPRLLANQSGAYPDGELTHEILESFYGVTHDPAPFTYNPGCERIPENWYGLRSVGSSWTALQSVEDVFSWCVPYPELCGFGGNLGRVDTFAGLRLDDPGTGLANLALLADGSNLLCFALQVIKSASPSWSNNLFATLFQTLGVTVASVGCPEIPDLTRDGVPFLESLQQQFPGAQVGW